MCVILSVIRRADLLKILQKALIATICEGCCYRYVLRIHSVHEWCQESSIMSYADVQSRSHALKHPKVPRQHLCNRSCLAIRAASELVSTQWYNTVCVLWVTAGVMNGCVSRTRECCKWPLLPLSPLHSDLLNQCSRKAYAQQLQK